MWLVRVCREAASTFVGNLAAPVERERRGFPMEDDPVGEFLARKEAMGAEMEDGQAQESIDRSHPRGISGGEVVVECEHVDAAPGQRVQVRRQHGGQRLAFAGLHFRQFALMHSDRGDHLNIERP